VHHHRGSDDRLKEPARGRPVKRTSSIRLVLLGVAASAAASGAGAATVNRLHPESVLVNDTLLPGVGYYHAPFNAFYSLQYNAYDPVRKMYYYGGMWWPTPHRSIVNISAPSLDAIRRAEQILGSVPRSGFGSSGRNHGGVYS
jgi:hypothetical protein